MDVNHLEPRYHPYQRKQRNGPATKEHRARDTPRDQLTESSAELLNQESSATYQTRASTSEAMTISNGSSYPFHPSTPNNMPNCNNLYLNHELPHPELITTSYHPQASTSQAMTITNGSAYPLHASASNKTPNNNIYPKQSSPPNRYPGSFPQIHSGSFVGAPNVNPEHVAPIANSSFHNAHNFAMHNPTFLDNVTYNTSIQNQTSDTFMAKFLDHTIPGAAHDSSARDPPPRCHPGTRLSAIEKVRNFGSASHPGNRLLWVVGPAGVGKSAIMQTVAETSTNLGASLFFSVNGRDNPKKAIPTLAYQLAARDRQYYDYIRVRVTRDPDLPQKSMAVQFKEFITQPYAILDIHKQATPLLLLVDGLDECNDKGAQSELLRLISDLVARHLSVLLLWVIASRPEPHITSVFESIPSIHHEVRLSVDDTEGREDVEKYLRKSFVDIRAKYPALRFRPQWPTEEQILKILSAASGLFAYASTLIRFIDNSNYGKPAIQLRLVLELIDNIAQADTANPLALLYALYDRILADVPVDVWPDTYRILAADKQFVGLTPRPTSNFGWACEWLRMPPDVVYGALHQLHSVLRIPSPEKAMSFLDHDTNLESYHKSFWDYFHIKFPNAIKQSADIHFECSLAILKEVPLDEVVTNAEMWDHITLHWPWKNYGVQTQQRRLYREASTHFRQSNAIYRSKILASRSIQDPIIFHALRVMDISNRFFHFSWLLEDDISGALIEQQILRRVPISSLDLDHLTSGETECIYICHPPSFEIQNHSNSGYSHVSSLYCWLVFIA
ncbi:hypothetical protein AN958_03790 [Leucoagaricus sp. SymC.cos]|nr:hypothetical protein AN958_03790 [Leucoagaricus sp. SymC.cos]